MANIISKEKRWYKGIVPFAINMPDFDSSDSVKEIRLGIQDAIDEWNKPQHGLKVKLQQRSDEPTFLLFMLNRFTDSGGSNIGMGIGMQIIWAPSRLTQAPNIRQETKRVMLHEIGHALGLYHEVCRQDRDQFIKINWDNIEEIPLTCYYKNQFDIEKEGQDFGCYDFNSIMHYSSKTYAKDKNIPVLTKLDGSTVSVNTNLSSGDIAAIKDLYADINDLAPYVIPSSIRGAVGSHVGGPKRKRVIQPPSFTVDPPPLNVNPPQFKVKIPAMVIEPPKMMVTPPPIKIMGKNYYPPAMEISPPPITIEAKEVIANPPILVVDPPPITVTPPPITIEV